MAALFLRDFVVFHGMETDTPGAPTDTNQHLV